MGNNRRIGNGRAKRRARPAEEVDQAKVERLRSALERGDFGMDFDMLVERLVHAMRS